MSRFELGDSELWTKVGPKLESLTLHYSTFAPRAVKDIGEIEQHCRNIRCIDIPGQPWFYKEQRTALLKLILSYGDQLEKCYLDASFMNERELKLITSACSKARFDVFLCFDSKLQPT